MRDPMHKASYPASRRFRLRLLLLLFAMTAGLVLLVRSESDFSFDRMVGDMPPAAGVARILVLQARAATDTKPGDAFSAHDWTPPPPPPPPQAPPEPPQAPPLPFTYLGKQQEGGANGKQWIVFLSKQDRTYTIRESEVIDASYRVEKIAPPLMTLTYLPLQQQQTLPIGAAE